MQVWISKYYTTRGVIGPFEAVQSPVLDNVWRVTGHGSMHESKFHTSAGEAEIAGQRQLRKQIAAAERKLKKLRTLKRMLPEEKAWFKCQDCDVCTNDLDEYYMVRDDIWPLAPNGGMLCIGCLEARLGRELNAADFKPCMLTDMVRAGQPGFSARLRDRATRGLVAP